MKAITVRSSGSEGICSIPRVASGSHEIEVSRPGFVRQTVRVSVPDQLSVTASLQIDEVRSTADVVATTPLPGVGLTRNEIPAPVQDANAADIERSGSLDLSDLLNRRLNGVYWNEIQGNPYQADVSYRGYTASPLLGTPQGLSIYMDGVRLNQPFGDIVSWDLIPRFAISEMTLMPGSNPLFGLNTLGGAISVQTKDGMTFPRTSIQGLFGSYGRKSGEFEHGGSSQRTGWNWYLGANLFGDDGWRESSPTTVRQAFAKVGRQFSRTSVSLTASLANNALVGNGLQEQRLLDRDYSSIYTKPDITTHKSTFLNFAVRHSVSSTLALQANAYYRQIRTRTLNGDINEESLDQSMYQPSAAERAALAAAGYTGVPVTGATAANTPFPFWRCIGQVLLNDEPAEKCNGLLNRSRTTQHNGGSSGQATWFLPRHQFTVGAAYDESRSSYSQTSQLGYLAPDRSVIGLNAFADGRTGGEVDGEPFDTRVELDGRVRTASIYASELFRPTSGLNITLSGRFNRTVISNRDRIRPGSVPGSLDGTHAFSRFNPAVGFTYNVTGLFNVYASYSEGSRSPTSIELGCADPNQPCRLPNSMAGDPPLNQVVTRTVEAGVRGGSEKNLSWNAGWFSANNHDDILFVASQQTGFGYFKNFGKTRRQGIQVDARYGLSKVHIGGGYTLLSSTFQSAEEVNGESNSSGDDGIIDIRAGNRIPLTPRHLFKAYADYQPFSKLTVDLGVVATSNAIARGNENNQHRADGQYFVGRGDSPGYAVASLGARLQITKRIQWFVQVNNLFNRQYYSAAQLGPTGITPNFTYIARPFPAVNGEFPVEHSTFLAPGAPRIVWTGFRLQF
jgi:outer membrane receptor protein involved in Fe transport